MSETETTLETDGLASKIRRTWRTMTLPSESALAYSLEDEFLTVVPLLKERTIDEIDWDEIGYPNCLFTLSLRPDEQVYYVGAILHRLVTHEDYSNIRDRLETSLLVILKKTAVRSCITPEMMDCISSVFERERQRGNLVFRDVLREQD